jgi:hypothetical protein
MNCEELHYSFLLESTGEDNALTGSAEMAEHLRICADCNRFIEAQRELGASLRVLRESAPSIYLSLDAAVLSNYRRHLVEESVSNSTATRAAIPLRILRWSPAFAVAILVAVFFLFPLRTPVTSPPPQTVEPAAMIQPKIASEVRAKADRQKRLNVAAHPIRHDQPANSIGNLPVTYQGAFPAGFRSLMYCDELSCADSMEMIRVQLTPAVAGFATASAPTNSVVYADVLVGPDGIARGIRIVQ